MLDFKEAFTKANKQFIDVFRGDVTEVLKGSIEIVECITADNMARVLDTLGGIDAWHIRKEVGIRGIALRVQTSPFSFRTFTIRKSRESGAKTEYEKRKLAIEKNYLYPYLTFQAYVKHSNEPIEWAIAKTEDIIKMIDNGKCTVRHTNPDKIGQAEFYVVSWDAMKNNGYPIVIKSFLNNN